MNKTIKRLQELSNRQVLLILISVSVLASLFSGFNSANGFTMEWWTGYADNLSSEMLGAFLTFILLEMILGTREEKEDLIMSLGSKDNATAMNALKKLQESGWLTDGSLEQINLELANLKNADLRKALLKKSNMRVANLEGAALIGADLEECNMHLVNLQSANLQVADLRGANLQEADLRGANLKNASFAGCIVNDVICDAYTILPDGTPWQEGDDFTRFSNIKHPDHWSPDWMKATMPINMANIKPSAK